MNQELKWEIIDNPEHAELILFFDCLDEHLLDLQSKKVLIRQEPKMVLPQIYTSKKLSKFDLIMNVGKPKNKESKNINWPQRINPPISSLNERNLSKVVLINSNLLSLNIEEMYSLRREVCFNYDHIDLYGYGWNSDLKSMLRIVVIELRKYVMKPQHIKLRGMKYYFRKQKNYKGSVEDKILTMEKYQISLVIENTLNYVSEKLFDSFSAGCVPVYVGPDLIKYEIPNNLYVQAQPNKESIFNAIEKAQKIDYAVWFKELEKWITSDDCKDNWSEETYLNRLKDSILHQ
jgi:alpha(1,3/1,4) fucosyltransferase